MVASLNGRVQQLESQLLAAQRQAQQHAQQAGPSSVSHEVKVCRSGHLSRLHRGVHLQAAHPGWAAGHPTACLLKRWTASSVLKAAAVHCRRLHHVGPALQPSLGNPHILWLLPSSRSRGNRKRRQLAMSCSWRGCSR